MPSMRMSPPRRSRSRLLIVAALLPLCFGTVIITSPAHALATVTSQDLVAPAGAASQAQAINAGGLVAGTNLSHTDVAQISEAYIWSPDTGMRNLGSFGGQFMDVRGISDGGHVVGNAGVPRTSPCPIFDPRCSPSVRRAFRWDEQNGLVDLGTLGGGMSGVGSRAAVNASGQVVGVTQLATGENRGFLSSPGQPMVALEPLEGAGQSDASAINSDGVVAGMSTTPDGSTSHAVIWTPTPSAPGGMQITDLGALPDPGSASIFSRAVEINDAGQVAGVSNLNSRPHAFLWSPGTGMTDLGTLPGSESSTVVALSETGQVVGQSGLNDQSVFSWTAATGMVPLPGLSANPGLSFVFDVSDTGQVVGQAYESNDSAAASHAFSWTSESGLVDLTPNGLLRSAAYAVSNSGQIVGTSEGDRSTLWTVGAPPAPGSIATTITGGETVTTDPAGTGATPAVPVQTVITVPAGVIGTLSVTPQPLGASPTGYDLFGKSLGLEGPPASAASPYTVTFTVDGSALGGIAASDVQVFRNGTAITGCTSPTQAIPDPCVVSRGFIPGGGGDAQVTVRTSHFSTWNLGKLSYALKAGIEPVNLQPIINTVKAGSVIPVLFKLGGNKGLDIFTAGYPKTSVVACGRGTKDEVEITLPLKTSLLLYEPRTQHYVYAWKTDKAWKGCRDLVINFKDGSSMTASFLFR
jgi:probable HAF family extracellular repeat protein